MKTTITNVWILTMDQNLTEYKEGFLTIEKDKIVAMGHMKDYVGSTNQEEEIIDGKGGILMPGMINVHTHVSMVPFRSLGDDCKDRLRRFLFPLENECMTPELVYHGAKYGIGEMLLSGVTTMMDMYYFEDEVAKAADEMGIRAFVGETVINFATCDTTEPYGGLGYGEELIKKWKGHERIVPFIAPHATNTNSEEALIKANELSKKYDVPFSMHVAELDYEMDYFREQYQTTPIGFLNDIGVLNDRLVAAHCIYLSKEDIGLMKENGVGVAHCIGSNTKAAKGVAPIKALLEVGVPVGLGTDGPSSGNTLDVLTQFKLFANFHKVTNQDRSIFPAKEIVKLGTSSGAKVLHEEKRIGSLEVGKKADLVLVETESVNMFPIFDAYSALVYSANASNVEMVFVNGKCVVKDKQLVHADLRKIRKDLNQAMDDFKVEAVRRSQL
ncbi:MAG: amidohydrolase [Cellulosilyticum sp.]|nr:amidohydrolase [Cellulosilyticum sp.]